MVKSEYEHPNTDRQIRKAESSIQVSQFTSFDGKMIQQNWYKSSF